MNKYLIIGASGFLGSFLYNSLNEKGITVSGTCFQNKKDDLHYLNLENFDSIHKVIKNAKPDIIIHIGGLTDTDYCEANQSLASKVNCFGTNELMNHFDGKIIYFSTDYVFDGDSAPYDENSQPNPINHYGKTKLTAEKIVLSDPNNLVVRVSGLYGFNKQNNRFLEGLRKNKIIRASPKLISTPTYIEDIVRVVQDFMQMSGILHFSGEQPFSRYDFAKLAVERLGFDTKVVAQESNSIARRPKNSSLRSVYNLRKTPVDEALKEIRIEI